MLRFAYNTNGLAHHRLDDALRLLADLGYAGVALTLDVAHLDPLRSSEHDVEQVRALAERLGLAVAVETGARFVLDPRRKHFPTLLEEDAADRGRRVDFLVRCVDVAAALGAGVVSLWSGAAPCGATAEACDPARGDVLWARLVGGLRPVLERARERAVRVAFEPEPGMFVERPAGWSELVDRGGDDLADLGLCLDVGHLLATRDRPEARIVEAYLPRLVHVHLDDGVEGKHEHLPFGEGELDLAGVLGALARGGYRGLAAVELSRDSHRGAESAARALDALRAASP